MPVLSNTHPYETRDDENVRKSIVPISTYDLTVSEVASDFSVKIILSKRALAGPTWIFTMRVSGGCYQRGETAEDWYRRGSEEC